MSERRALRIVAMSRSAFSYKGKARDCSAIRLRMREITQTRIHYGCERVFVMLRREGWRDNHKRVHRIYKEEGLSLRHCRPRRSRSARRRQPIKVASSPNTLWGMDFVSDALFDGRRFRLLTVVDHFTHECLDIVVDQSLRGEHVAEAMARLVAQRGRPAAIKVDNGSEFAGKVMDRWAYENGVELDFSRRGTPTDNALVESFNGRPRQECLNEHWFLSLRDARSKIEAWRRFYNEERPPPHCTGVENPCGIRPRTRGPSEFPGAEEGRNLYRLMALLSGVGHCHGRNRRAAAHRRRLSNRMAELSDS